jgi:hypothetical protein
MSDKTNIQQAYLAWLDSIPHTISLAQRNSVLKEKEK